jgi:hypothetical protein
LSFGEFDQTNKVLEAYLWLSRQGADALHIGGKGPRVVWLVSQLARYFDHSFKALA